MVTFVRRCFCDVRAYARRLCFLELNLSATNFPFQYWLDPVSHKDNHIIPLILKIAWTGGKKIVELKLNYFLLTQVGITSP